MMADQDPCHVMVEAVRKRPVLVGALTNLRNLPLGAERPQLKGGRFVDLVEITFALSVGQRWRHHGITMPFELIEVFSL